MRFILALGLLCGIGQYVATVPATPVPVAVGITATLICKKASATCTVTSTVPINGFVVLCQQTEGAAPLTAPHDSSAGANTYTLDKNQDNSSGAGVDVSCYHSKLAAALTSGVSTVTWGSGSYNNYFAVSLANLPSAAFDVAAGANQSNTTAFNSGATATTAGSGACVGVSGALGSLAIGSGWTLIDDGSSTALDSRQLGVEWKLATAAAAVTATATMSASTNGVMIASCYK